MPTKPEKKRVENALQKACEQLAQAPIFKNPKLAYTELIASFTVPSDETPPTKEQWEALYDVAGSIRALGTAPKGLTKP